MLLGRHFRPTQSPATRRTSAKSHRKKRRRKEKPAGRTEAAGTCDQVPPPVADERIKWANRALAISKSKLGNFRTNTTKVTCRLLLVAAFYIQMVTSSEQQHPTTSQSMRQLAPLGSNMRLPMQTDATKSLIAETKRPRHRQEAIFLGSPLPEPSDLQAVALLNSSVSGQRVATNEWTPMQPPRRQSLQPKQQQASQHQEVVASAASFGRRHWRRPRFHHHHHHEPIRKLYRRVLLCEKTLVSLDYLRIQQPNAVQPPDLATNSHLAEFGHDNELDSHHNNNDDEPDNFLDNFLGSADSNRLESRSSVTRVVSSRHRLGRSHQHQQHQANLSSGGDIFQVAQSRSYLTNEDPLVKCDMWDLEKGLKSRKPPEEALRMAVRADFDTVRDAINRCRQLTEKTLPPDDEFGRDSLEVMSTDDLVSLFSIKRGLIPGTKWCGLGDQASSYNDLGSKHRIDICCRAHDHCPIRLKPFRNDYGVLNLALYTKSHCDCDADFYRCLREAHSRTADMLGNLYFNVMKLQCMREERQKVCREMKPLPLGFERCIRYEDSPVKRVFKFTGPPVAY